MVGNGFPGMNPPIYSTALKKNKDLPSINALCHCQPGIN